jgi:hypothetical protein
VYESSELGPDMIGLRSCRGAGGGGQCNVHVAKYLWSNTVTKNPRGASPVG